MKISNIKYCLTFLLGISVMVGCKKSDNSDKETISTKQTDAVQIAETQVIKQPSDFIPDGYTVFQEIKGDLNKDGLEDLVIIIKATKKEAFVTDEFRGKLDRNRRGLLILFKTDTSYELALKNTDCFSSENEDGGVYVPPDLVLSIEKGNLFIQYAHGRYGYWEYNFRYKNPDFMLIGYESSSNEGPVVNSETSINFLTNKKRKSVNTNYEAESGEEVFEEHWETIPTTKIKLAEVVDFDELNVTGEE